MKLDFALHQPPMQTFRGFYQSLSRKGFAPAHYHLNFQVESREIRYQIMALRLERKLENNENQNPKLAELLSQASTVVVGKEHQLKLALTAFLAQGHLLIEDLPGMGKTTFAICLAKLLGLSLGRIQFTNDLLPADILGSTTFDPSDRKFEFHQGPIFNQIVLGDELNRASPKTQSAFLQAMEEHKISIDGKTHVLPSPFLVIATQNPNTQIGTYPLPESQLDRFLMRLSLGYPNHEAEVKILASGNPRLKISDLEALLDGEGLKQLQNQVQSIPVSDSLVKYVQKILATSRTSADVGLSPRAGIQLLQAARSWAKIGGRDIVLPEDIQAVAEPVLEHRLNQSSIPVREIVNSVPIP